MRIHSFEKIEELRKLRKLGYSINELVAKLSIPKTTVWHHIHKVIIPRKYSLLLKAKRGGSAKRSQRNWERARNCARELLCSKYREYAIAIAMLYWGEGSKKSCGFINSDGKMIRLYLDVLVNLFDIEKEKIVLTMRIFSGMDEEECLSYWSKITGFSKNKFVIRFNDGGKRGRTKYGMCRVSVRKGSDTLKIMHSLIEQAYNELINSI